MAQKKPKPLSPKNLPDSARGFRIALFAMNALALLLVAAIARATTEVPPAQSPAPQSPATLGVPRDAAPELPQPALPQALAPQAAPVTSIPNPAVRETDSAISCAWGADHGQVLAHLNQVLTQDEGVTVAFVAGQDGHNELRRVSKPFRVSQPTAFPDRAGNTVICVTVTKI